MFAYNPGVTDRSGEFLAQGIVGAGQANQQMYNQLGEHVGGTIRKAGQAAAGFAMGGPAGAAMAMQGGASRGGSGGGDSPDSVLGSFVSAFANNKALEAKGEAYADFMGRHGEQLGFDPNYLKDFMGKSKREQAMIGDNIIGMQNTGRQLMNMNYLNAQMAPRATVATGAGRAGGGGGGDVLTF